MSKLTTVLAPATHPIAVGTQFARWGALLLTGTVLLLGSGATPANAQLSAIVTPTQSASLASSPPQTTSSLGTASTAALAQASGSTVALAPLEAPTCGQDKLHEIFETAEDGNSSVTIDCSFSFDPPERITKRLITKQLIFTGNTRGVTVDCRGGAIGGREGTFLYDADRNANIVEIVSEEDGGSGPLHWNGRPQDITIRNCEIVGTARIWAVNDWKPGNLARLAAFSRQPGYVSTLRANAPRGIHFDTVTFNSFTKYNTLWIGAGVTETEVVNSTFLGGAPGVIIYLDAESSRNVIRNNVFDAETDLGDKPREIIAIDGSDHNRIIGNIFWRVDHGGIELYRNCGEFGVVRHTTPSHNHIINNVFPYNVNDGDEGAVVLGSRNGADDDKSFLEIKENVVGLHDRSYCHLDMDFPGGSGADNRSFATHNVVMQNQFYKHSTAKLVQTPWTDVNVPNFIAYNDDNLQYHEDRPSGCYVDSAYGQFLRHGETTRLKRTSSGLPTCRDDVLRCDDGVLVTELAPPGSCQIDRESFGCDVSGDNRGCTGSSICPSGTTLVRVAAACNLESGSVTSDQLQSIRGNDLRIVVPSDDVSDGSCHVGSSSIASGETVIERERSSERVYFGCSERDENGGDCHVRGELYCQNLQPLKAQTSAINPTMVRLR